MTKGMGKMNIPFSEKYDNEDDIYYVSFKTNEPSYCLESDDTFLIELGMFTNLPTGFRILQYSKNKPHKISIGIIFQKIKKVLHNIDRPTLGDREKQLKDALSGVFA